MSQKNNKKKGQGEKKSENGIFFVSFVFLHVLLTHVRTYARVPVQKDMSGRFYHLLFPPPTVLQSLWRCLTTLSSGEKRSQTFSPTTVHLELISIICFTSKLQGIFFVSLFLFFESAAVGPVCGFFWPPVSQGGGDQAETLGGVMSPPCWVC